MFSTFFKLLALALQLGLAFFLNRKKQNTEAQDAANYKTAEATLDQISEAKKTQNEIDQLTPDQRREYARSGMWPDTH